MKFAHHSFLVCAVSKTDLSRLSLLSVYKLNARRTFGGRYFERRGTGATHIEIAATRQLYRTARCAVYRQGATRPHLSVSETKLSGSFLFSQLFFSPFSE